MKEKNRKTDAIVMRPELLPAGPRPVPDGRAEIERFIEQKITEMTTRSEDSIFEPWFRSKAVAAAVKRSQTVIEQQKWSWYFAKWGCLICGTTDKGHASLGMCQPCYSRVTERLKAIIKEAEAARKQGGLPTDLKDKANTALRGER